ncbi:MAG: hypothetical protein SHS37scaffold145_69 [Phage 71_18]|nr:MAG: hypothetical protein SHS37scaffold145_69 [Phage 71_18]
MAKPKREVPTVVCEEPGCRAYVKGGRDLASVQRAAASLGWMNGRCADHAEESDRG